MFYCKAQVAYQQISTPPTLYTSSFNRGGIWSQHMDGITKTIFGKEDPFGPEDYKKSKNSQELFFSKKL